MTVPKGTDDEYWNAWWQNREQLITLGFRLNNEEIQTSTLNVFHKTCDYEHLICHKSNLNLQIRGRLYPR